MNSLHRDLNIAAESVRATIFPFRAGYGNVKDTKEAFPKDTVSLSHTKDQY